MNKLSLKMGFLGEIDSPASYKKSLYNNRCTHCGARNPDFIFNTKQGKFCRSCLFRELQTAGREEDFTQWTLADFKEALSPAGSLPKKIVVILRFWEVYGSLTAGEKPDDPGELIPLLLDNLLFPADHPMGFTIFYITEQVCKYQGQSVLSYIFALWSEKPVERFRVFCRLAAGIERENRRLQGLLAKAAGNNDPGVSTLAKNFQVSRVKLTPYETEIIGQEYAAGTTGSGRLALYRLESVIRSCYHHRILELIYNRYLCKVSSVVKSAPGNALAGKMSSFVMVNTFAGILLQEATFRELMQLLPVKVKALLEFLAWNRDAYKVEALEKEFACTILLKQVRSRKFDLFTSVDNDYLIIPFKIEEMDYFFNRGDCQMFIPRDFAVFLKKFFPHPPWYNLEPREQIPPVSCLYIEGGAIIQQINIIYNLLAQDRVQETTQGRITQVYVKRFTKAAGFTEFFDPIYKDLAYTRARLLIRLMQKETGEIRTIEDPLDFLKNFITGFFAFTNNREYRLRELLEHINGSYYYREKDLPDEIAVRREFFALLKTLREGMWYSINDIYLHIRCRDINLDILDRDYAAAKLSYMCYPGHSYGYAPVTGHISPADYPRVVLQPLLKTLFFLVASFGLADLAYNYPGNIDKPEADNSEYFSPYDGLQYVRLSPLGAYITGSRTDPLFAAKQVSAVLTLDDKRLYIYLDNRDPVKQLILGKLAVKLSDTCYKVNYQSFLGGCATEADIKARIGFFKKNIAPDPPAVWQEFLAAVQNKIDPLVPCRQYLVFRLKDNKELAALFANDKILKQYTLKAENYHIVVNQGDLARIRKRLEEFGYFIKASGRYE